jgi:hypothetical protein
VGWRLAVQASFGPRGASGRLWPPGREKLARNCRLVVPALSHCYPAFAQWPVYRGLLQVSADRARDYLSCERPANRPSAESVSAMPPAIPPVFGHWPRLRTNERTFSPPQSTYGQAPGSSTYRPAGNRRQPPGRLAGGGAGERPGGGPGASSQNIAIRKSENVVHLRQPPPTHADAPSIEPRPGDLRGVSI